MPVTRIDFPIDELTRPQNEEEIQRKLAQERARLASMMGLDSGPVRHFKRPAERPFSAEERGKVTILFGGLTWKHERVIQAVFEGCGYRCEIMPVPNVSAFQLGKEYGNNGQCNPTYFTVGNLVQHLQTLESRGHARKQEIINNYIFFTAGSCGPCRFGMYESEYRLALQNAGFDGFRVLLFQQNDGVKAASGEAGLKFTVDFGMGMFNALNLGDIMNEMIYRIRPYEVEKGKTDEVFQASMDTLCTMLRERKPFEDHEDLPEWMAKKIRANKGKKWEIWVNSLGKVREQLYGNPYKEALAAVREQTEHHRGRPPAGEAGGQDHRRVLGADHRRRRQLPHVRVPGARRRAGAGRADRHLGDVHDVPGQGARRGPPLARCSVQESASGTSCTSRGQRAEVPPEAVDVRASASAFTRASIIASSRDWATSPTSWSTRRRWPTWPIRSTTSSPAAAKATSKSARTSTTPRTSSATWCWR